MKAVWYEKTGPAKDVLIYGTMEKISPQEGEVLVRLHASGVNPSDVKARAGIRAGGSGMPYPRIIPHSDGAGIIEAVGPGVSDSKIGKRVWVWNGQWGRPYGTAAEYIILPFKQVVALPENVSFETGASLGIPAVTAAHCVYSNGDVTGKTVLISGGAGTVGRLMVQFARIGGAHVIATAMNEADMARALKAGAHKVLNFTSPTLANDILQANNGKPVDRIVEVEFGVNAEVNAAVIKNRGNIVTYGSALALKPELPFYTLMFKGVTVEFVLVYLLSEQEHDAAAKRVNDALTANKLDIPIHATFPIERCWEAHESVEKGGRVGSVIVTI